MNIERLYEKIADIKTDNHLKAGLYFSIIQLKKINPTLNNVGNSIYQDAKLFISVYIKSVDERDLGYDIIDTAKIIKCINLGGNNHEQYLLAQNSYRLLKTKGFEEESKKLKKIVCAKKTTLIYERPYFFGKYLSILLHLSTYNFCSIILTVTFLFLISIIVLLPAPFEKWGIFKVTYQNYSEVFLINHIVNLLSNIFGIKGAFNVDTNSAIGILSIIAMKLFYMVFIVNYFYRKILDILNND